MTDSRLTAAEIRSARHATIDLAVGYPELTNPEWIEAIWRRMTLSEMAQVLNSFRPIEVPTNESLPSSVVLQDLLIECVLEFLELPASLSGRSALTPSGSHALERSFATVVSPGDRVLVPFPCIDIIPAMLAERHAEVLPLHSADFGVPGVSELADALIEFEPAAVVLTSPDNPTGSVWSAADLERLCGIAAELNCVVILDHCFANVRTGSQEVCLLPSVAESTGVSWLMVWDTGKFLDLDDEKIGMIVASENLWEPLQRRMRVLQCTLPRRQLILITLIVGRLRDSSYGDDLASLLVDNLNYLDECFGETAVRVLRPCAGGLALLVLPDDLDASQLCALMLDRHGVGIVDAATFYGDRVLPSGIIRIALGRDVTVFRKGIDALVEVLASHDGGMYQPCT